MRLKCAARKKASWAHTTKPHVISRLKGSHYKVQYKDLVEEEDHSRPLVEIVTADEVRPLAPKQTGGATRFFSYLQRVNAFDNDGWWVGRITGRQGLKYWVYFPTTGDDIAYPVSQLRNNVEWCDGNWVSSK
ncbi:Agenet-like domain - like 7 [Theobroma cacao]|nr:Agenet-like domain - like 7 [Theobroma cacao]